MPQKDSSPARPTLRPAKCCPALLQQRVAREAGEFGGSSCVGDLGVATATGGIDVHVGDATPL